MRKMKQSGIEWIGEIPEDWEDIRLKFIIKEYNKSTLPASYGENIGNFPFFTSSDDLHKFCENPIYKGNAITMGTGGKVSINYSEVDFSTSTDCYNFTTKKDYYSKFIFYYLINQKQIIDELFFRGMGLRHLQKGDLKSNIVFYPKPNEQQAIADFLDKKCEKIDSLISMQEQMIEHLKAYKQSVITEAVTKGLDKSAPLKDSGIEWIGQIPEHWKISFCKNFYNITLGKMLQPEKKNEEDTLEDYLCSLNINKDKLNLDTIKKMWFSTKDKINYEVKLGDLVVVEGGDVASPAIINNDLNNIYIQNAIHRVRAKDISINKYLYYWLLFAKAKGYVDLVCNKATIAHFTKDKFENTPIAIPQKQEQQEITNYLDNKCADIDKLIDIKKEKIEKLNEFKKSLIYEYVTGKKEVAI